MRALVTGCAGFIGSELTESLLEDGHEVVGVDCFNDNYGRADKRRNLLRAQQWEEFDFVPLDLARGDLASLVEECEAVFHLAAEPGVRGSWGERFERYQRNNVVATQHLLEAARRWPERPFVYASSSSVYGQAERLPTREDAALRPVSPYGVTKLAGEHLCGAYHDSFGVQAVCLRYFSVYGPRQRPDMAFSRFCRAALGGEEIVVFGDGRQTRDFTFVGDVVQATRAAAERPGAAGRTYNVGAGSRASLNEALRILAELSGRALAVRHAPVERSDVRDTGADSTLARAELGFAPRTNLEDGLRRQLEYSAAVV